MIVRSCYWSFAEFRWVWALVVVVPFRRIFGGGGDGARRQAEYEVGAEYDRRRGYEAGAEGALRLGDEYELQPPPPPRRRAESRRAASQVSVARL